MNKHTSSSQRRRCLESEGNDILSPCQTAESTCAEPEIGALPDIAGTGSYGKAPMAHVAREQTTLPLCRYDCTRTRRAGARPRPPIPTYIKPSMRQCTNLFGCRHMYRCPARHPYLDVSLLVLRSTRAGSAVSDGCGGHRSAYLTARTIPPPQYPQLRRCRLAKRRGRTLCLEDIGGDQWGRRGYVCAWLAAVVARRHACMCEAPCRRDARFDSQPNSQPLYTRLGRSGSSRTTS